MRLLPVLVALVVLFASPALAAGPRDEMRRDEWSAFTPIRMPPPPGTEEAPLPKTPGPAPDLRGFAGQPIARIAVEAERGMALGGRERPAVRRVRVGEPLDGARARAALEEVLESGAYASARVEARLEQGGVALVVVVVPRKLIDHLTLDVHGAEVDTDPVLRAAGLVNGGEFIESLLDERRQAVKDLMLRHGYPSADVSVVVRPTDDPTRVTVSLEVQPGPKRVIERRWFYVYGAKPDEVRSLVEGYDVDPQDRADEDALTAADDALVQALRSAGWFKARVMHDLVLVPWPPPPPADHPAIVTLRVRVETGPRFIMRFEGADHFDDDALSSALGVEAETDRTIGHLADKLRAFYLQRGFLDVEITPHVRGNERGETVAFVFRIIEHGRVRVSSRAYPCLNPREISRLRGPGPPSTSAIGSEIDSFLEEELPGADLVKPPDPTGLDRTIGGGGAPTEGTRALGVQLDPNATFVPDVYDRAVAHVQELYRSEGYLHALVGPVLVVRATCKKGTQPGVCIPEPLPPLPTNQCTYDSAQLPLPVDDLPSSFTCVPDPDHSVTCAPNVDLLVPVKLGPRTRFYDVAFVGAKSIPEKELADSAQLPLGTPVNTLKIEEARRKLIELYKDRGFYWVDVKYTLEYSLDSTNARVRFDIVEGELVRISDIVIRGNEVTNDLVIRKRIVLQVGAPYRSSDVRLTQQFLGTLGVFSSVDVQLEDSYMPARYKRVFITLVERTSQYVDVHGGFSSGEGLRGAFEYGHRNLLGDAVSMTFRVQASYLPSEIKVGEDRIPLILDPDVRANYDKLTPTERIARRITLSFGLPEIGLGPRARTTLDAVHVQDLERDFALTKYSLYGTIIYNFSPHVQVSAGQSVEFNGVNLFTEGNVEAYLRNNSGNPDLARLLRVPNGNSAAFAQRIALTWDRRDNPFNAHTGTFVSTNAELVNSFPLDGSADAAQGRYVGHFVRMVQTIAGYLPMSKRVTLAASLRVGHNVHLYRSPEERTYPDRLFFLGGPDSMRGWHLDAFVPQEYVNKVNALQNLPPGDPNRFTIADVPLRGGDFMINPRIELRFPIRDPVESVLFTDIGNIWQDPAYLFNNNAICRAQGTCGSFRLRADVGTGLRVVTPVGPLVFDVGINVTREQFDDPAAFNFAIGLF